MTQIDANEVVLNGEVYVKKSSVLAAENLSGDYVVIRSKNSGVHAG